jgi:hypothetical protein
LGRHTYITVKENGMLKQFRSLLSLFVLISFAACGSPKSEEEMALDHLQNMGNALGIEVDIREARDEARNQVLQEEAARAAAIASATRIAPSDLGALVDRAVDRKLATCVFEGSFSKSVDGLKPGLLEDDPYWTNDDRRKATHSAFLESMRSLEGLPARVEMRLPLRMYPDADGYRSADGGKARWHNERLEYRTETLAALSQRELPYTRNGRERTRRYSPTPHAPRDYSMFDRRRVDPEVARQFSLMDPNREIFLHVDLFFEINEDGHCGEPVLQQRELAWSIRDSAGTMIPNESED